MIAGESKKRAAARMIAEREELTEPTRIDDKVNLLQPLLTIAEVAKILRCSQRTIRRLIQSGRLRAVQAGRMYRFRGRDIAEFVQRSLTTQPVTKRKQ